MTIEELWQSAVHTLDKHKAEDIKVLEVSNITSIADYFLLASGGSANQVKSLSDYVEEELAKAGKYPLRNEGYTSGDWIMLDYGDVLIHVFRRETRDFYDLERLWVDATDVGITPYMIKQ
jgi:ribosome-associated protein